MICLLILFAILFSNINSQFNPCLIDPSICIAFEDFDVNCTCILLPDENSKSIKNITDEVYLWFSGLPISLDFIQTVTIEKLFREKLSIRIPQSRFYDFQDQELSENIYRNLEIVENIALFEVNSSKSQATLDYLIENEIIRSSQLSNSTQIQKWCLEGECNAFVYESQILNRTEGIYSHTAEILQIIEYKQRSIFAVSSVFGVFSVPRVQHLQCEHRCKVFYWNEREMCRENCVLNLRYDKVAVTGDIKRNFDYFVQSAAVQNFRNKYRKYVKNYPR
ncbi:unnamed protein product [Caenorhabditis angaria]|uniref:Receptor L-domain domain-containing protein n=1 Tax=Caenorhabditis angaria TaxID=860376 RepID=A0A9P1IHG5_9PELO|nr:unnamed protein product [Caenorhabditis angaria]